MSIINTTDNMDNPRDIRNIGTRLKNRNAMYRNALFETPYAELGESTMPLDAQAFINKRASLQEREKTAAGVSTFAKGVGGLITRAIKYPGTSLLIGGSLIGLGELGGPLAKTMGNRVQELFVPSIRERENLDGETAKSFAKSVGKAVGIKTVRLLSDMLSKAVHAPSEMLGNRDRAAVFQTLQNEDDILSQADPKQLTEAYHTMVRFAPTLATDKNAVKTFLRESVLYGTGPNFMSIRQLADAENAVNPPKIIEK